MVETFPAMCTCVSTNGGTRSEAENLKANVSLRSTISALQPVPPFFSPKKYRSWVFFATLRLERSGREYKKYRSGFRVFGDEPASPISFGNYLYASLRLWLIDRNFYDDFVDGAFSDEGKMGIGWKKDCK